MAMITWEKGEVPHGMRIRQIYGICFTQDGRVLLRIENGKYKLTGGKPENDDADRNETLEREFFEEVNTVIGNPVMVGYQLVDEENGSEKYAQIRMTALIESIGEPKPDPDRPGKWIYGRYLTSPSEAARLLNWGEVGVRQIHDAFETAKKEFGLNDEICGDQLINEEIHIE